MDDRRFDALIRILTQRLNRRAALTIAAGSGALAVLDNALGRKRRNKRKKKNKNRGGCLTVGGQVICPAGAVCCDPTRSTAGGCAERGFPICCASSPEFSWELGTTCCADATSGTDGVCNDPEFPHCCSASAGGGCCEAEAPVCCIGLEIGDEYCCPGGQTCCPETESGCCTAGSNGVMTQAISGARLRRSQARDAGRRQRRR